ncbi:MAG: hypothetical protein BWK80_38990 [Desulfobacteraceae bacterium IS3]|jgi:uncharacterized protein (UPF0147 family)|nr:MAG: hypothetical protein BWK80_38990 [Desulfobacteraceae bacterium IS3]HAO22306.1 hypothetical protein [Desulfobacteraceae bacterium]
MNIASQYAVLSEDGSSLMLPGDVRAWLKEINRFLVIMENDRLILKKANTLKKLDELLSDETLPLFSL